MRGRGPIWLMGMMGAGKSSVGRALAVRLARPFVDTDAEIERAAGCSVAEIFASEGEPGFRRRECAAVEACADSDSVVALGGGAVAQPQLARLVAAAGASVYLRARPETLLARVGNAEARPLLTGLDAAGRLTRVRELLSAREPAYAVARECVDTDDRSVDEVAAEVASRLGLAWAVAP